MKSTKLMIGIVAITALSFMLACQKGSITTNCNPVTTTTAETNDSKERVTVNGTESGCVQLTAGQTINSGSLCFDDVDTNNDNVDDALKVTYATIDGWQLTEIHFWIGSTLTDMPMTKGGNPIPGQFPYTATNLNAATSYSFLVPFSAIGFSCPNNTASRYVAAHAAVRKLISGTTYQTETAWGAGTRIATKGNWGMYFNINITCDSTTTQNTSCSETAFAKSVNSSTCFTDFSGVIGEDLSNRWGWSNEISTTGTYTMTLWAGAGLCNTTNGTNVGVLTVNYNNGSAVVSYSTSTGFSLGSVHLYVGSTPIYYRQGTNTNNTGYTIAPGQFPYKGENLAANTTGWTYTVPNLSGTIYVVAHADVKGFVCPVQ